MTEQQGGLVRPEATTGDAAEIARTLYGITAEAVELGSNQDRNFALTEGDGTRSVLRIDNPVFGDAARVAQHAALDAYRAAGVAVAAVLPGLDGALTQRWRGLAVRRSEFATGEPMVDAGYFAPTVLREFGALAAESVLALAPLAHEGLDRGCDGPGSVWDMRRAHEMTLRLAPAILDDELRERVIDAANLAFTALAPVTAALPVQAIHGDLTDDNVMGERGADSRLHPRTVLDLGDLAYGWRVAELAVTASSLLHHEPERPLRVLDAIGAFHARAPLSAAEARAVWPLVVLRASLLVASGWRQIEIDGGNAYARDRIAGEQAIFDAATRHPLAEATESVLARLGFTGVPSGDGLRLVAVPAGPTGDARPGQPLASLLPGLSGEVAIIDAGVESAALDSGKWLEGDAEQVLVDAAFADGAAAAVLPYGVYRLTRTATDAADAAATWPANTVLHLAPGDEQRVAAPVDATVAEAGPNALLLELAGGWLLGISGISPSVERGAAVPAAAPLGTVAATTGVRIITIGVRRPDAMPLTEAHFASPQLVVPELAPTWRRFAPDPAPLLGLPALAQRDESDDELARRTRIFASAQERYYAEPMQIERGWRHHLVDTTGRSYVDIVNNVSGIGHAHPAVADAVDRQIRILNTNSRFLYRELAEYSERLLATLPPAVREGRDGRDGLDTVLLVNSGSEAVDLAIRLAQAATGRKTVIALREAYHGWTMASDAVTTSAYDNPYALESRPDWIHIADVPNRFRGTYRGAADDLAVGARYSADLGADLAALAAAGRDAAGFICESVLGNAGGVLLPEGYLPDAYDRVHGAGGLCIADEVQVGFGRMGTSFWGFEQSGAVPDIITIAKPMGNGFPIGGVITSKRVADALSQQGQFFSTAGGNAVSCRVGIAVLDAMRDEQLQQNAALVGGHLADGFRALAEKHDVIGHVHGEGLYLGVELVRDRTTFEPATAEASAICERLRELGVIVLTTSERSNVLKVKPPLCLTVESADFVLAQLDRVLSTGW
ncbi:aminotransferase [Leucobacter sp. gxy201]|uniref:aminotransferase n=1 Tax=Leucobacter sp. gxy201 TaxID=2957200 RepID=UPI003DA19A50